MSVGQKKTYFEVCYFHLRFNNLYWPVQTPWPFPTTRQAAAVCKPRQVTQYYTERPRSQRSSANPMTARYINHGRESTGISGFRAMNGVAYTRHCQRDDWRRDCLADTMTLHGIGRRQLLEKQLKEESPYKLVGFSFDLTLVPVCWQTVRLHK